MQYAAHGLFEARTKFCGGSLVLWQPTPRLGASTVPQLNTIDPRRQKEKTYGWIATRQPSSRRTPIHIDITDRLESKKPFSVVWDSRWLLEFDDNALERLKERLVLKKMGQASDTSNRFIITAEDQWYQPCVKSGPINVPLASASGERVNPAVNMTFIRSIDAI